MLNDTEYRILNKRICKIKYNIFYVNYQYRLMEHNISTLYTINKDINMNYMCRDYVYELKILKDLLDANVYDICNLYIGITDDPNVKFEEHINNDVGKWDDMLILFKVNKGDSKQLQFCRYINKIMKIFSSDYILNSKYCNIHYLHGDNMYYQLASTCYFYVLIENANKRNSYYIMQYHKK